MKGFWDSISRREKYAVICAGISVLLFLGYFLLVRPVRTELSGLRQEIPAKMADLAAMRLMAGEAARLRQVSGPVGAAAESPLKLIDQTARQYQIDRSLRRLEPAGSGKFKVWLEDAVYVDLISWLRTLGAAHGIDVDSLTVERAGGPGLVNVRLSLGVRKDEGA